MDDITTLVSRLKAGGLSSLPPEHEDKVFSIFSMFGVVPTPQVVKLYSATGGGDDGLFSIWSLDEIKELNSKEPTALGILFADYFQCLWRYRLKPSSHGGLQIYVDESDPPFLFASLEDFISQYLKDPDLISWQTSDNQT